MRIVRAVAHHSTVGADGIIPMISTLFCSTPEVLPMLRRLPLKWVCRIHISVPLKSPQEQLLSLGSTADMDCRFAPIQGPASTANPRAAPRNIAVVYEDRRLAGEHIVRVAYSRPVRRVTHCRMPLTWTFIDRNGVNPRPGTWLTATVTATRADTSARPSTTNSPSGPRWTPSTALSSNSRPGHE